MRRSQAGRAALMAFTMLVLLVASPLLAEQEAWIRGDVKLNVRTGPSTDHRIVAGVETGDSVLILARADSWTQVRTDRGKEGWIPAGYLDTNPPPNVRLDQLETELARAREQLTLLTSEAEQLRDENESLSSRDSEQQESIQSLTAENLDLKAGARWPYLISGASILGTGMVVGLAMGRSGKKKSRIRL